MVFGSEVQRENTWLRDPATWLPPPRPLSDVVVVVVFALLVFYIWRTRR